MPPRGGNRGIIGGKVLPKRGVPYSVEIPFSSRLSSLSRAFTGAVHPALLHALTLVIPLNIYVVGGWIGAGIQFPLFRYQDTSWGISIISIFDEMSYVLSGTLTGRTAVSISLWVLGTVLLVAAFLAALLPEEKCPARLRGFALTGAALLYLLSLFAQYGLFLHGPAGIAIPVGIPFLLIAGLLVVQASSGGTEPGKEPPSSHRLLWEILVIFLVCFLVYNTATGIRMSGDTTPAQIIPLSILKYGEISADHFLTYFNTTDNLYAFVEVNGHYYSYFPIVTPVLVAPLYILPYILGTAMQVPLNSDFIPSVARFVAAFIAAAGVVVVYLTLHGLVSRTAALVTTATYAFATSTWAISSQALWQHGMVQLLLALLLFTIVRNEEGEAGWHLVAMGVLSGLLAMARPPDALLLIPVIIYVLRYHRGKAHLYLLPAFLAALPFLLYNLSIFGSPLGGYEKNLGLFGLGPEIVMHYAGFLVAPNAGFFIFSPVLLFGIWGYFRTRDIRNSRIRELMVLYGPVLLLLVLLYSFYTIWMGAAYGPRFLAGLLPVYILYVGLFLDYAVRSFTGRRRAGILAVFSLLLAIAIGIQIIGAFYYPFLRDVSMDDQRVWDPADSLILRSYRDGAELMTTIHVNSIPPLPRIITVDTRQGGLHLLRGGPSLSREDVLQLSNQSRQQVPG
jgi:hypothetical protein